MSIARVHRRSLLIGSASLALAGGMRGAAAQQSPQGPLQQLEALEERAKRAGVPTPAGDAARASPMPLEDRQSYRELRPRLLDLIDRADASAKDIAEEADELLGRIHREERSYAPAEDPQGRAAPAPSFDNIKGEYRRLFDSCTITPKSQRLVDKNVEVLKKNRSRYEKVGADMGIPWYFIGIIHSLECSFRFTTHLHNGDSLRARTVRVPAGRPAEWGPPTDWESSAADAMLIKNYNKQTDWSLERILFRWEQYNGWGYRGKVNSPYLWSFTNQYTKGKYVEDHKWIADAVSQQTGAASLLMGLVQAGEVPKL